MNCSSNFEAAKEFVSMKRRHGHESLSGPGSHLANAGVAIGLVESAIREHRVRSILDLGCGDFNWMKEVDLDGVNYTGWDACEDMIGSNNEKFGNASREFLVKDIIREPYPEVDLIICRDVLFHLSQPMALVVIDKVKSMRNLFMSTSFSDSVENKEITGEWGFYTINLSLKPFLLSEYEIERRHETGCGKNGNKRFVCMYDFSK